MLHLDGESPAMRKCVLSILGEIVLKTMNNNGEQSQESQEQQRQDLEPQAKEDRDQYLDCLEDHVHDVHANVRSNILQVSGNNRSIYHDE